MTEKPAQLRLLDRFCLYHHDLSTCAAYCRAVRDMFPDEQENRFSPIRLGLVDAIIVTYARPFTDGRSLSGHNHRMGGKQFRFDNPDWNEAHEWLLKLRKKAVAHSDGYFTQVAVVEGQPPGSYHSMKATLTLDMVALVEAMANNLCRQLEAAIADEHEREIGPIPRTGTRVLMSGHSFFEEPDWVGGRASA